MKTIKGDLIALAQAGDFDVITHGCNCFCAMGAGIAPLMARAFGCDTFKMEDVIYRGSINKLGTIDYQKAEDLPLIVVNSYTQYKPGAPGRFGIPLDYDALSLCLVKINSSFGGKRVGLPFIGAGLAGGDPIRIYDIMKDTLINVDATLVVFDEDLFKLVVDYELGYR